MKNLFWSVLLVTVCIPMFSQNKIVERSDKKTPEWIGKTNTGFVISSAEGSSLDEAQKKAMDNIKQEIINSIAVNITSSEQYISGQISKDNLTSVFEDYSSNINSTGAILPFITGISMTKADEIYWEKVYVKNNKSYYYVYHIKYPFSETERSNLVDEFLRLDFEKTTILKTLQKNLNAFTQVEYIDYAVGELQHLIDYFFDKTRKSEATALQQSYRQQYANISIVPVGEKLGEYKYALYINGRVVTTAKLPKVVSEFVMDLKVKPILNEQLYVITYNCEYSNDVDDNNITLTYNFGGRGVKHTFHFDIRENLMKLIPTDKIYIRYVPEKDTIMGAGMIDFSIISKYNSPVVITEVSILIPEFGFDLRICEPGFIIKDKGHHSFSFNFNVALNPNFTKKTDFTRGWIKYKNPDTQKEGTSLLQLPYEITKFKNQ